MDAGKFDAKVRKWIASRSKPVPEVALLEAFTSKLAEIRGKYPISDEDFETVSPALESRARRANWFLILHDLLSASKSIIRSATSSKAISSLETATPDSTFQSVNLVRTSFLEATLSITNKYLPPDSPTWALFNVDRVIWAFEVNLVGKYRKKIKGHFQWLEDLFLQRKGTMEVEKDLYEDLTFEGFEYVFLAKSEERKREILEEMNRLTYGTIPRTVSYQYELEVFFSFQDESEKLMNSVFLPRIIATMRTQMQEIRAGSRPVAVN